MRNFVAVFMDINSTSMDILIADSGSTKTEWLLDGGADAAEGCAPYVFRTSGLNPSLMADAEIVSVLRNELVPFLRGRHTDRVVFFGAGCTPSQSLRMATLLRAVLAAATVEVMSDLEGAALALCGDREGVVAILGTGSGSALYDGRRFVQHTPSLGYILGDEGSGAVLGRNFISDLYKGMFPTQVATRALPMLGDDMTSIIENVYRRPRANRYLASFTHVVRELEDEPSVRDFLVRNFEAFFRRNILPYGRTELPVHFVGSIAAVFESRLREAAAECGCRVGDIVQSPLQRMAEHLRGRGRQ